MTDNEIALALAIHTNGTYKCTGCPYMPYRDCSDKMLTDSLKLIHIQQAEIERLESLVKTQGIEIDELNNFANERLDKFTERYDRNLRAEAVKEFAERFDDVLVRLRDEYAHNGRTAYGLVCEVVHHKLLKTVKEMVGTENEN